MAQVFDDLMSRVPRVSRREMARANAAAAWVGAVAGVGARGAVAALVGGDVRARIGSSASAPPRSTSNAIATVRIGDVAIDVRVRGGVARRIAERLLGSASELAADRSPDAIERAVWAAVVAAALEDLGVAGEVWPQLEGDGGDPRAAMANAIANTSAPEPICVLVSGAIDAAIAIDASAELAMRAPPSRGEPRWLATTALDCAIVLGRCALTRASLAELRVRDVITLEPPAGGRLELVIGDGAVGLRVAPGAVEAAVATGYVRHDMALPDDAHLELTVALGTTRLTLRALTELAIGQIVPLGRPLAGPFELRAGGQVIGHGELVDVEGELGVRVTGLGDSDK